ncbi:MAG TPA: hypothetical protein VNO55_12860 [Polyangia bacterium]|nr:hypothetical protein [Polyangia bacterium]
MWLCCGGCAPASPGTAPPGETCDLTAVTAIDTTAAGTATADDVERIFKTSCALGGCHAGVPGAGDLSLSIAARQWRTNIVGRKAEENPSLQLVEAGNPARSWLIQKVTGQFCAAGRSCDARLGCGDRMPFGQSLSKEEITTLYLWVRAGAAP